MRVACVYAHVRVCVLRMCTCGYVCVYACASISCVLFPGFSAAQVHMPLCIAARKAPPRQELWSHTILSGVMAGAWGMAGAGAGACAG